MRTALVESQKLASGARRVLDQVFALRWRPDLTTAAALGSYVLVVLGMLLAFQVFTTAQVAGNFIAFGPLTLVGLGIAVPVLYTVLVRRGALADLGISTRYVLPSLALGLLLGLDTYRNTLATMDVAWTVDLAPLVGMVLAVSLFEAVFFRGWLQLRLEAAFGLCQRR